ncbi:type VI secretion system tip protein VgrG [Burkholderia sp. MSMB1589WGS]|uniref:type VI secretion system tip protein VgrG n=1 Tax=Burkholderia sp. MSMB1589WGS TaxID=1636425 RepID=UPI000ADE8960|nr:type VI secretion system tip protein VgrG [Burkholderia sp. MSMB1589WGS]
MATKDSQFRPPDLELLFGKSKEELRDFQLVSLEVRHGINQIPTAKLILSSSKGIGWDAEKFGKDIKLCRIGESVELKIKSGDSVLFSGVVVQQECLLNMDRLDISLKMKHNLHRWNIVRRSKIFEDMSDADILRVILKDTDIHDEETTVGKLEAMAAVHQQMIQFDCTDWQFIKARLNANGVWLMPTPEGIDVVVPKLTGKTDHTIYRSAEKNKSDILMSEARWQFNSEIQPEKIEVFDWEMPEQKMSDAYEGKSLEMGRDALDPAKLPALTTLPWTIAHSLTLAGEEQLALANGRLLSRQASGIVASFTVLGNANYALGQSLAISGYGEHLDGVGLISEITHAMTQGTWRTTLTLGKETRGTPEDSLIPSVPGLHIGIVAEYEEDPNTDWNRIKVIIPMLRLDDQPLWARFAAPYASKDSGLCLYPEPGDEVVLGFFEEDPRHPVILGALHNPINKPPYPPSEENAEKGLFLSVDGLVQSLIFDREQATATLTLTKDDDKHELKFSEDGISLSTVKDITAEAEENITLKAEKKLKAEGVDGVDVVGKKIDLKN